MFGFRTPSAKLEPALAAKVSELEGTLLRISLEHAPATLASGLSIEDMVITDAILRRDMDISVFTLDSGSTHGDRPDLVKQIKARYGYDVAVYKPDPATAARDRAELAGEGKFPLVDPPVKALLGHNAWISGLRRGQKAGNGTLAQREFDSVRGMNRFHPLIEWTREDVLSYLRAYKVPHHVVGRASPRPDSRMSGHDARTGVIA